MRKPRPSEAKPPHANPNKPCACSRPSVRIICNLPVCQMCIDIESGNQRLRRAVVDYSRFPTHQGQKKRMS